MTAPLARPVRRHPLVAFFVLAYAVSWSGWLVAAATGWPLAFLPCGPLVAALIVAAVTRGRSGLRALGARMVRWRVGWRWYAVVLGLPLALHAATAALAVALGAPAPSPARLAPVGLLLVFALRLVDPLDGPLGEEPGWRGFALPGLQAARTPLVAALILGTLAAGWHLPLLFVSGEPPLDLLQPFAFAFVAAWVVNHTGGSGLMALLLHAAEGTLQSGALWAPGAGAEQAQTLYPLVWCSAAVAVVVFDWPRWRTRLPESRLTPAPAPPPPAPAPPPPARAGERVEPRPG
jgi:membrane protease YdiL (CAAX protease family)